MPKWAFALDERLDRSPRIGLALSLALLLLVGVFHHGASHEYSFDFFYLLPVAFASRYCGRRCGLAVSVLAAGIWFSDDYWVDYDAQFWLSAWHATPLQLSLINASLCLAIFVAIALLVSALESNLRYEKAVSRTKSEMLSVVSHEFSNALTSMGMAMFVLDEEMGDHPTPHQKELYELLQRNISNLKSEVENLLNQARMESGRFVLEPQPVDAAQALRLVLAQLEPAARQKKITLAVSLPSEPTSVRADADGLHLILTNLIGNAIKYTPTEGKVSVGITVSGNPALIAEFSVEDTGIGMSRTEVEKALEGFARTARGRRMARGVGLGLKTARDMVESHGAKLKIKTAPGKGSRFSFTLPVIQVEGPIYG